MQNKQPVHCKMFKVKITLRLCIALHGTTHHVRATKHHMPYEITCECTLP